MEITAYRLDLEELETKNSVGDVVEVNDGEGHGIVEAVYTEPFELEEGKVVDASDDSPVYEVQLDAGGRAFFRGSALDEIPEEQYSG